MSQRVANSRFHISPPCPECGNTHCKVYRSGADDAGNHLRERRCADCDSRFCTVEAIILEASFNELDVERKMYQKLWRRAKNGYYGQRSRRFPVTRYIERISVKVSPIKEKAA